MPIVAGDFNGDGLADIVSSNGVLLGNGDGTFRSSIPLGYAYDLGSYMATGDLNGDGNADLVIRGSAPHVLFVLLGKGDGTFPSGFKSSALSQEPEAALDMAAISLSDFNGDGIPDIVIGGADVRLLLGAGDGTFGSSAILYRVGSSATAVATGDWNGDGAAEVFFTVPFTLAVLNSFSSPRAGLAISANHGSTVLGSGVVTYTIKVTNAPNADTTSGMVMVAETRLGVFSMSGEGWSCAGAFCTRSDPLSPGRSYPPITSALRSFPLWTTIPSPFPNEVTVIGGSSRPASATDAYRIPPLTPVLGIPDGTLNISLQTPLDWTGPGATFFDIYFGTSSPPPLWQATLRGRGITRDL